MCLEAVTKKYKRPIARVVYAYKVFDLSEKGEYVSEFRSIDGIRVFDCVSTPVVPTGEWLGAVVRNIYLGRTRYDSGFHAFADRAGAKRWSSGGQAIVRVRLRGVHTVGFQNTKPKLKTYVASEMYVPKPRKTK